VMFHQWFASGARRSLTLPITCDQRCSVSSVSYHSASGMAGQGFTFAMSDRGDTTSTRCGHGNVA
jgi:hypothetical protein